MSTNELSLMAANKTNLPSTPNIPPRVYGDRDAQLPAEPARASPFTLCNPPINVPHCPPQAYLHRYPPTRGVDVISSCSLPNAVVGGSVYSDGVRDSRVSKVVCVLPPSIPLPSNLVPTAEAISGHNSRCRSVSCHIPRPNRVTSNFRGQ